MDVEYVYSYFIAYVDKCIQKYVHTTTRMHVYVFWIRYGGRCVMIMRI